MSVDPREVTDHPIGDRSARQRFIAYSVWFTVPGTFAVLVAAYALVPPVSGADDASQRVILTLGWLLVAILPYVASCLLIATVRFFEGSHDPLAGTESERLKIHCRVMQNTLEQFVWFAFSIMALAAYLSPNEAHLVPVTCTFFAFARFVYWWGYLRSGTLGRAPGVQLTFTLNIALYAHALVLLAKHLSS